MALFADDTYSRVLMPPLRQAPKDALLAALHHHEGFTLHLGAALKDTGLLILILYIRRPRNIHPE